MTPIDKKIEICEKMIKFYDKESRSEFNIYVTHKIIGYLESEKRHLLDLKELKSHYEPE
jgi:hypothetical protein